jgi:hypothetical protein
MYYARIVVWEQAASNQQHFLVVLAPFVPPSSSQNPANELQRRHIPTTRYPKLSSKRPEGGETPILSMVWE